MIELETKVKYALEQCDMWGKPSADCEGKCPYYTGDNRKCLHDLHADVRALLDQQKPEPEENPAEYALLMDAETAHVVSFACEMYARLRNGQFNELRHLTVWPQGEHDETFCDRIQRCEDALREAKRAAFPEFAAPDNQHYGIGHFRDSDTAWNAYQALRYALAWQEHPEGGDTVNFRTPVKLSDAPMPRCTVALKK